MESDKENKEPVITMRPTVDDNLLLDLEFWRNGPNGLEITVKSPISWAAFAREGETMTIGGVKCFRPKRDVYDGIKSTFKTNDCFEYNGMPNLSILLAKDLKEGVKFLFGEYPISDSARDNWVKQLRKDVKVLFLTYLRASKVKVRILSHIIEEDEYV